MADFEGKKNLRGTFGQCLTYLMFVHGTRPYGSPDARGECWVQARFAGVVGVDDRTVRYWLDDKKTPSDLRPIERALFGEGKQYDIWRTDLRALHELAKKDKARRALVAAGSDSGASTEIDKATKKLEKLDKVKHLIDREVMKEMQRTIVTDLLSGPTNEER